MKCCGNEIPEGAGKYGCPNCEGDNAEPKTLKLVAECRWYWRDVAAHKWVASGDDEPYVGPACIGPSRKKISIWLPSGKRIVKRVGIRGFSAPYKAVDYYGGPRRNENKIEITLRELQPGEPWPMKPHADTFKL